MSRAPRRRKGWSGLTQWADDFHFAAPDRRSLVRLGLSAEAIGALEIEIGIQRAIVAADIPSRAEVGAGFDHLAERIQAARAAIGEADELTLDRVEAMLHGRALARHRRQDGEPWTWRDAKALLTAFAAATEGASKEPGPKAGHESAERKRSIAAHVIGVLHADGVEVDERPKGAAVIAIDIVLRAVGLPVADPRNYVRAARQ